MTLAAQQPILPSGDSNGGGGAATPQHPLIAQVINQVLASDEEFRHYGQPTADTGGPVDYLFASAEHPQTAAQAFARLSWGGQFVFVSPSAQQTRELANQFAQSGFRLEWPAGYLRQGGFFRRWLSPKTHYFIARKVQLVEPEQMSDRFTYQVELVPHVNGSGPSYIVSKQVPPVEAVAARLHKRFPDLPEEVILKRAQKFSDKIFPTFLTREAAILMILQDHLPAAYAQRVPRIIQTEKDARGHVRKVTMNWLRNGGRPLSQLEFAMQSADLLRAIHDSAEVIHLDLRLDNFVITERGVGFVDFGSSVRVDEDVSQSPLLGTLFDELMRTSQIQRMLAKMTRSGHVTAKHLCDSRGKIDKSVDVFYLAVQFNSPHVNPDLRGLIQHEPASEQAQALGRLTQQILRPVDPANPPIKSAKDVLRALELVERDLRRASRPKRPAAPQQQQTPGDAAA